MSFTNETFFKLLDSIKEEEDCQLDNYAVVLKADGYIIECYKNYEYFMTDTDLYFDSCGSIVFGKYSPMTLTDYQYKLLNDKFDEMRSKWLSNYETALKEEQRMYNDDYDVRAEQGLYGYGY